MKSYKSKITNAVFLLVARHIFMLVCFGGIFIGIALVGGFEGLEINHVKIELSLIYRLLFLYSIYIVIYLSFTNNDILLKEDTIIIKGKLLCFYRKRIFKLQDIKHITFKHDWTETAGKSIKPDLLSYVIREYIYQTFLPPDYKWMKIQTDKIYTFYCFGLEFDYYDNKGPLFEDLFIDLADKGIEVQWTNTTDPYYIGLTNRVIKQKPST